MMTKVVNLLSWFKLVVIYSESAESQGWTGWQDWVEPGSSLCAAAKPLQHSGPQCGPPPGDGLCGYAVTCLLVLTESDPVGREIQDVACGLVCWRGNVLSS